MKNTQSNESVKKIYPNSLIESGTPCCDPGCCGNDVISETKSVEKKGPVVKSGSRRLKVNQLPDLKRH